MIKFKIICPKCRATIITAAPKSLIWELCPGCKHYIWDIYDVMMAERVLQNASAAAKIHALPQ